MVWTWSGKRPRPSLVPQLQIPFQNSVRITVQASESPEAGGFYIILRGGLFSTDPLKIGDVTLPSNARLRLEKYAGPLKPLEVLDVANIPTATQGSFSGTLAVFLGVGSLNFLEGCFHMYDPPTQPFPNTVIHRNGRLLR